MNCYNAWVVFKVLTIIFLFHQRNIVSNLNKVRIEQFSDFPFVTYDNIVFPDNDVISLLCFAMKKG